MYARFRERRRKPQPTQRVDELGNDTESQDSALPTHGLGQAQSTSPKRKKQRVRWTTQNNIAVFKAFHRAKQYKTQTLGHERNF